MYIYENHTGGLFASGRELSYEECYCETCGDSDWLIGEADTREEVLELLRDEDGFIPYTDEYMQEFLNENFGDGVE